MTTGVLTTVHGIKLGLSPTNQVVAQNVTTGAQYAVTPVPDADISATATEINEAVDVSVVGVVRKTARVAFGATELSGSEVNTSFVAPAGGMILLNAFIYVADAEGGGAMDVGTQGTSNDPDGILDGISLASTGYVFTTNTLTTGLNGQYISATTAGALNHQIDLGTDDDGDSGFVLPARKLITGADPISITANGDLNSCSGYLYLDYLELAAHA